MLIILAYADNVNNALWAEVKCLMIGAFGCNKSKAVLIGSMIACCLLNLINGAYLIQIFFKPFWLFSVKINLQNYVAKVILVNMIFA